MGSILIGMVLTFASTDGEQLQLTVTLARSSTVSLMWEGRAHTSTTPAFRHHFGPLGDAGGDGEIRYSLHIPKEAERSVRVVRPASGSSMEIVLYGDSRDGPGPAEVLSARVREHLAHVVVHTGDAVRTAADDEGWIRHLRSMLPLGTQAPLIAALGNHEMYVPPEVMGRIDPLARTLAHVPPPADALRDRLGAPKAAYHVRTGDVMFVVLDSNARLDRGSPQYVYLEEVLKLRGDAKSVFIVMHHGPFSSGPHGGHPHAADFVPLLEAAKVTAVLAGHDHIYERIVRGGITYIVSGGGGAPLYERRARVEGSVAFVSAYNYATLAAAADGATTLEAYSLEGALLDRGILGGVPSDVPAPDTRQRERWSLMAASLLLLLAFVFLIFRVVLRARMT